jgi:predicted TIM-barrel fold metal-dependent hydrolase
MTVNIPRIVSADDHIVEPPDIWESRLPQRYRDVGPRIEYHPVGTVSFVNGRYVERPGTDGRLVPWWHYEDRYTSIKRYTAAAGFDPLEADGTPIDFDQMRPGCWQPKERLADMDLNHIDASLCFPNYPRFCGQIFNEADDRDLGLLCVRAYNDWMVDEWCGDSNGRLIPLCLVPLWDVELAAEEVRRNAARGVRAVAFSELPGWLDLPSFHSGYWDPFLRACEETGTVVCMHIGSGTRMIVTSEDAPIAVGNLMGFGNTAAGMSDVLMGGLLARFTDLRLMYAECQIGWIPFLLQRADDIWIEHKWSFDRALLDAIPELPSTYYKGRIYSCFFKDAVGLENLHHIGEDQVLFESDYPHNDGTWPNTRTVAEGLFGGIEQRAVNKICRDNAIELFGLDLEPANAGS